jgi:hypothetical protein
MTPKLADELSAGAVARRSSACVTRSSECGVTSSGSVMVPCPWFPSVAAGCQENADIDVGVHLTLTCDWDRYRSGPISTRDPASGAFPIRSEGWHL